MAADSPEELRLIVIGASADSVEALQTFNRPDLKFVYGAFGSSPQDDIDDALSAGPDVAIVGDSPRFDRIVPTFRHLMLKKIPVVSDSGEMVWPWLKTPHLADVIANEAKRAGVAIAGVGNDPAAVRAVLPVLKQVQNLTRVVIRRHLDGNGRQFGHLKTAEEFRKLATAGIVGLPGVGEMVTLIAQALDRHPMRADIRTTLRPTLNEQNRVIGLRQTSAWTADGLDIEVEHVVDLHAPENGATDTLEIIGDTTHQSVLPRNESAKALLDTAASIRQLPPGLHTPLDLFNT